MLTKVRRLPRRKTDMLAATGDTPEPSDWARVVRETRRGDGVTLYWWAVAVDGTGARRSTRLRSLVLGP